jgi:soluble lytic murein transglycosylase-like protein
MLRVRSQLVLAVSVLAVLSMTAAQADIYKYLDEQGNTYFTDSPIAGPRFRLVWKRESERLVSTNRKRLATVDRALNRLLGQTPGKGAGPSTVAREPQGLPADQSVAARRARFDRLINAYARVYGLSPQLLHAVIRTESAYDHEAVSRAGAEGLMQLMPGTAARYGVKDSFNPVENVRGGAAYLRDLLDMFGQDLKLALAGYNAGENAVIRNGNQIPPYAETQNYVRQVLQYFWSERSGG